MMAAALAFAGRPSDEEQEPRYDPATVTRINGPIEEIREATGAPLRGIHVTVRSDKRAVDVYLCPAGFLKQFALVLSAGDEVQVSGSKVKFRGNTLILAQELRRKNDILVLRDDDGKPYWEEELFKSAVRALANQNGGNL